MLQTIAADIAARGGRAFYVGGYVRDQLMQLDPKADEDIDIEIFSLDLEQTKAILSRYGTVIQVGKSFPVLKISGHHEWDFTLPAKPDLALKEACARRDFTINSMMMDILSGEIKDFYNGQADIANHIIRHTRSGVFQEDPLRAYRAVHFAARFDFSIHPETIKLISQADLGQISRERIYEEIKKLLLLSAKPSIGLRYMQSTGILERMHPLLFRLVSCRQTPEHHPEGSVWEHTLLVADQAARLKAQSSNPSALMFAALLHDIGKPKTSRVKGDKITTYGHDALGAGLAAAFMEELTSNKDQINAIALLIKEHMRPVLLYKDRQNVSDKAIRKLVNRINLKELLLLAEADFKGRSAADRDFDPIRKWFEGKMIKLGIDPEKKLEPLVQGRDLLKLGIKPGPSYASVLTHAFDLQLDGKTKEIILDEIKNQQ
jgi:uncharacterized domain HDIG